MAAPLKHAMSLEQIAEAEGTSPRAIHTLICRALKKLRSQGLVFTARELAIELDRNRKGSC
jgi:DNA-binding CsgD family transcriptional regulator